MPTLAHFLGADLLIKPGNEDRYDRADDRVFKQRHHLLYPPFLLALANMKLSLSALSRYSLITTVSSKSPSDKLYNKSQNLNNRSQNPDISSVTT